MKFLVNVVASLCLLRQALAADCTSFPQQNAVWNITESVTNAGEKYLTVNGLWPAKPLVYKKCTKLALKVINSLPEDSVSLHWHGLLQRDGQAMMDGVVGLTQSGIAPKQSFTYYVILDKEGTNWVHSHSAGQYPQGLRAPLIVLPQNAPTTDIGDEIVTLSDWWPNFKAAEARSHATDSQTCGTEGIVNGKVTADRNVGIELPPVRVTFNDVNGYNKEWTNNVIRVTCNTQKRIRLINISAVARFYVAFSDGRDFQVTELDGISYQPRQTSWLELASGQRASITVNGFSSIQNACRSAYIIAMSDPKVNAGTTKCPMTPTNSSYQVQWTHGKLFVDNAPTGGRIDLIPGTDFPEDWARKWNEKTTETTDVTLNNRLKLPYKGVYFNDKDPNVYGATRDSSRPLLGIMGVGGAEELNMVPSEPEFQWRVPADDKPNHMHYIYLDHLKDGVNPPDKDETGFAAMTENLNINPYTKWESPAGPDKYWAQRSQKDLPSLYRALHDGSTNEEISLADTYYSNPTSQKGKTIMFNDNKVHWFIIQSMRGDHPMHLHGHHFQVLAKLPKTWFKENHVKLYDHVVSSTPSISKADINNPPRRDTLFIDKEFTYVIAIKADNPGVWAFHCHNDMHAQSMFSQIIERPVELRAQLGSWGFSALDSKGKGLVQWFTSTQAQKTWRSKDVAGDWMVANLGAALKRYGWDTQWKATNTKNPSKWDVPVAVKRWLPRGSRWS